METIFICAQCGKKGTANEMIIVSESENAYDELRGNHMCGFIAIRCKAHKNALQLAQQAVRRHLRRVNEKQA